MPTLSAKTLTRPGPDDLVMFFRNFAYGLQAGMPVASAISAASRMAAHPKLREFAERCSASVMAGIPLHVAFAHSDGIFPPEAIQMIRVGEMSATLPESLMQIAEAIDRRAELARRVRGAAVYPCIVLTAGVAVALVFMTAVIPQVAGFLQETRQPLPLPTRVMLGISSFVVDRWYLLLAATVGVPAALSALGGPDAVASVRRAILRIVPGAGRLAFLSSNAMSARTFAAMLAAGVPISTAVAVCAETATDPHLRSAWERAGEAVSHGRPISSALGSAGGIHPLLVQAVAAGERTGNQVAVVSQVAQVLEREAAYAAGKFAAAIEPFMTIVTGAMLGTIVLSIYLPLLRLINAIR